MTTYALAPQGLSAQAALIFYGQQYWPGTNVGLDLGVQTADTGSGTSRTTTVTLWSSTSNASTNPPTSAYANSSKTTVSWTSQNSGGAPSPGQIPLDGPDYTARSNAVAQAVATLTSTMKGLLGLGTP
jgi:hypothetical protein